MAKWSADASPKQMLSVAHPNMPKDRRETWRGPTTRSDTIHFDDKVDRGAFIRKVGMPGR